MTLLRRQRSTCP
uniref:Uncharacterized protein n=1 Tax=Rhizophora mucronata TaxID=61149 RepID=A0A2P2J264_RHIMU